LLPVSVSVPTLFFTMEPVPLIALPTLWIATVLGIVGIGKAIALVTGAGPSSGPPAWILNVLPLVLAGLVGLSMLGAAIAFCRVASRAAVNWKWMLVACSILAVVGSMAVAEVGVPTAPEQRDKHASLMLGLGLSSHPKPAQVFQFAVPLAVCGLALLQQSAERRKSVLA